jgi:putative DNA primase/helicase
VGDPGGESNIELATEVHRSQLRMAERLAARHGHRLRFAHGLGWLVWDGTRWRDDVDGEPYRNAIEIVKEAIAEADEMMDADLDKDAHKIETSSALTGVLQIARYLRPMAVAAAELDADPWLFNTTSGTLDLRTGILRNHDPADLITKVAGCEYNPAATGPVFDRFIEEILPDAGVREFVQRLFGYALLGKVTEHLLPILTGVGCNGKTTLVESVMKAFGDYAIAADPELFVERTWAAHPTGQADLLGVRLAVTQETDEGRRLAAATVKRLTGGDKIRARKMRQDFFQFAPSHTAIMVTNFKPKTSSDDPALWRRIQVVPFDVVVTEIDTALPDKLELELPAILAWCVGGYQAYTELGLDSPVAVTERTEQYRAASDPLGRFLTDRTRISPYAHVRARELFHAWSDWCRACGEEPGSEVTFSDALIIRGFEKKDRSVGRVWVGLGLAAEEAE